MKKLTIYFGCLLLFIFSSCQEKDELYPLYLIGVWENSGIMSESYESVNRLNINPIGTYSNEWVFRDLQSGEDIGFQNVWNGAFRTTGNFIVFTIHESWSTQLSQPPFGSREEMVKINTKTLSQPKQQFSISDDGKELTIFADDPLAEDMVYYKVSRR